MRLPAYNFHHESACPCCSHLPSTRSILRSVSSSELLVVMINSLKRCLASQANSSYAHCRRIKVVRLRTLDAKNAKLHTRVQDLSSASLITGLHASGKELFRFSRLDCQSGRRQWSDGCIVGKQSLTIFRDHFDEASCKCSSLPRTCLICYITMYRYRSIGMIYLVSSSEHAWTTSILCLGKHWGPASRFTSIQNSSI